MHVYIRIEGALRLEIGIVNHAGRTICPYAKYSFFSNSVFSFFADALFRERDNLNVQIVQAINMASEAWGIQCMR